jgi:LAGLIDADG endonuclease
MPWEVLCLEQRHDPVTTEPFGARRRLLSYPCLTVGAWQIYGRCNTRALRERAWSIYRRTSPDTSTVRDASRLRSRHGQPFGSAGRSGPSLSVSQNGDRSEVLLMIQHHFGCGSLRPDRSDRTLKWEVRSLPLLTAVVVPHFRRYPLQSGKHRDFELFAEICERMTRGEHREAAGLMGIVRLAGEMNPSGKRGYLPDVIVQHLKAEMKA